MNNTSCCYLRPLSSRGQRSLTQLSGISDYFSCSSFCFQRRRQYYTAVLLSLFWNCRYDTSGSSIILLLYCASTRSGTYHVDVWHGMLHIHVLVDIYRIVGILNIAVAIHRGCETNESIKSNHGLQQKTHVSQTRQTANSKSRQPR